MKYFLCKIFIVVYEIAKIRSRRDWKTRLYILIIDIGSNDIFDEEEKIIHASFVLSDEERSMTTNI